MAEPNAFAQVVKGVSAVVHAASIFTMDPNPDHVNTVVPNLNFGASLDPANQGHPSTSDIVVSLFIGDTNCYQASVPPRMSIIAWDGGVRERRATNTSR